MKDLQFELQFEDFKHLRKYCLKTFESKAQIFAHQKLIPISWRIRLSSAQCYSHWRYSAKVSSIVRIEENLNLKFSRKFNFKLRVFKFSALESRIGTKKFESKSSHKIVQILIIFARTHKRWWCALCHFVVNIPADDLVTDEKMLTEFPSSRLNFNALEFLNKLSELP